MSGIGIIAEYNPFHNGHAFQLAEAKRISGADRCIVVMSASFVQRGEPACADKFTRAEWALRGGADLVIELPDILSLSCAERFAYGGIKLLQASGLANSLCFGSESGDIALIRAAAAAVPKGEALRNALDLGVSYPSAADAQLRALGITLGNDSPNDTLGMEYLRAISRLAPEMRTYAVKRRGAHYNDDASNLSFSSAAHIRKLLDSLPLIEALPSHNSSDKVFNASSSSVPPLPAAANEIFSALRHSVPEFVYDSMLLIYGRGSFPANAERLSSAVLFVLRSLGSSGISKLADIAEGLENVFSRAALSSSTYNELLSTVKTKRYTLNRLRRICMNALLGTTAELQTIAASFPSALYIRVLGARRERVDLLTELSRSAILPVIITHSDLNRLNEIQLKVLEHSRLASAIRALACPISKSSIDDFSHPLLIV